MYTSRDLTAYPRFKTSYSAEDLASFTPEEHDVALAEKVARLIPQQLAFVTLLKSFQQLSYFPSLRDVPLKVVEFIARSMGVPPQLPPDYERSRTLYRHSQIIREHLGYRRYDHKVARKLMRAAMYREAWIKDDVPDLINIALAELNRNQYELPAFDTISRLAQRIRTAVNRELGRAFGLCKLWGVDLMPRIRNWKGLKLLRPDADARYQHIDKLFADEPVNWSLIETHLPDMLRVVLSIRMGRLSPDLLKRILTTYGAKNRLNQALAALGRAVRTGYLLMWLSSRTLRQEVHSETNKSETIHAFYDFLTFGGDKIKQAEREEQDKTDKYEQLVGNLVSLYNTIHMTAILDELAREGIKYTDEDLSFLSPLITEHINRFGKYRVNLAKQPKITDLDALHMGFLSHHQPPNEDLAN